MTATLEHPVEMVPWHKAHTTAPPPVAVRRWVMQCVALCMPERVYWCDGSDEERRTLLDEAEQEGVLVKLNQQKWPGCYYHRSNSNDVARTEHLTFICTPSSDGAG